MVLLVDQVIRRYWNYTGKKISRESHDRIWEIAGTQKAPVPYEAVFISSEDLDEYDVQRSRELAGRFGWEDS